MNIWLQTVKRLTMGRVLSVASTRINSVFGANDIIPGAIMAIASNVMLSPIRWGLILKN